jgi:monovalent cation/proton antiporter MnhG/PhaG subunit
VKALAIDVLVSVAVVLTLLSCLGMLRMRHAYQQMHFLAPPASLSAALITIAIFLQNGSKPESYKAVFITLVLLVLNSVVTHATARAFRIRDAEQWRAFPGEEFPVAAEDQILVPGEEGKTVR